MNRLKFVTGNRGKVNVLGECLASIGLEAVQVELPLVEPQAASVEEVALAKARQAFRLLGERLVVEDSGFCVDSLSGFPGPYTKYVLETIGVAGLLKLAEPLSSRSCRFVGALVYIDEEGASRTFTDDRCVGALAPEMDGAVCSGAWSDLWSAFVPAGAARTLSALTPGERDDLWRRWLEHSVYAQLARWLSARSGGRVS